MPVEDKCLDFWGVYGEEDIRRRVIHMNYYPEKCIINLEPFFDEIFNERDKLLQRDVEQRKETLENLTRYNFTMIEFFEAFIGSFPQNELADFIEKHIDNQQPQSESFVTQVRNFDEDYKWCFPCWFNNNFRLYAVDFSAKELNKALEELPKNVKSNIGVYNYQPRMKGFRKDLRDTKFYGSIILKQGWPRNHGMHYARQVLIESKKPIIISKTDYCGGLSYFSLIRHYQISTENLEIIRKEK